MPKINEMLLKLEGLKYDMSINLSVTYYHIWLSEDASNSCTIIISWVNTTTSVYQWELATHKIFSDRKLIIFYKSLNIYVSI